MTYASNCNRFLHTLYPTTVFVITMIAWSAMGQIGVHPDFRFPKMDDLFGRALVATPAACAKNRLELHERNACQVDNGSRKLIDENRLPTIEGGALPYLQAQGLTDDSHTHHTNSQI